MTTIIDTTKMDKDMSNAEQLKKACPKNKVFEVTIKHVYMVDGTSHVDKDFIGKEWFGTHKNSSHAHRDGSMVGGADELIEVTEVKEIEENSEVSDTIVNLLGK